MFVFSQIGKYWRFAFGLRSFLREPLTLEQSRAIIKQRLANRERNLSIIVKRAIYENKNSPYIKLLKLAGCEYGDFERMVQSDGIEPTLHKLREAGVYISYEEFKGKKEVVRGGRIFRFKESDFDNPFLLRQLEASTGGSRSVGSKSFHDFDFLEGWAVCANLILDACDAHNVPLVLWGPILPGFGPRQLLTYGKSGKPFTKWFSPDGKSDIRPSLKRRMGTNYMVYMGRLCGVNLPLPEYVEIDEAWKVAQWIADATNRLGGCYVHTLPSTAVRICQAAREKGLDIIGTKFIIGGEPITKVKRQEIESTGASVCPIYIFIEGGYAGLGCLSPAAPDDVHLSKDSLALIQHERKVSHAEVSVDSFLFTSLLLSIPKVMLNVEIGDYGVVEHRSCGCYFDKLGFSEHIYDIRGFDKLTSEGMTFLGTDLIRIIEEVLPVKFGGTLLDYQMLEEEDEAGLTRMSIIVNPELGDLGEAELIQTVLTELGKGKDYNRLMAEMWSKSNTLRVKRIQPYVTARSKLLNLHIQKNK